MAIGSRIERQRQESFRSADSLTPADELSSWLGDDVCANCGAPARASHLYCSQECKDEDANGQGKAKDGQSSSSAPALAQYSFPGKDGSAAPAWRYACPPSPNLLAKYNSVLTSPALVALERSLPPTSKNASQTITSDRDASSMSSSGDSSSAATRSKDTKRRSSSQSTFSTASDAPSTDRSSPLSASAAARSSHAEDGSEDLDDIEPLEFSLPPSVHPAASILLNSASRENRSSLNTSCSITPDGLKRSPSSGRFTSLDAATPNNATTLNAGAVAKNEPARTTLDFARRPNSTNLPAPVLFTSPVLTTSALKSGSQRRGSSKEAQQQHRRPSQGQPSAQNALARTLGRLSTTERPTMVPAPVSSPAVVQKVKSPSSDGSRGKGSSSDSPPAIPSVSSSAGKTLRGLSPALCLSSSEDGCVGAVCGRYGCHGLGSSVESADETAASTSSQRYTLSRGHKHTHSAAAGLNLFGAQSQGRNQSLSLAAQSKLLMTRVQGSPAAKGTSPSPSPPAASSMAEVESNLKSPPRGRSKARDGRRSSSRRSPSPPRGAARRGRSEDLMKLSRGGREEKPASGAPGRVTPGEIAQSKQPLSPSPKKEESFDERRGRSPTEKRMSSRRPRAGQRVEGPLASPITKRHPCEMAWPAYGHDLDRCEEEDAQSRAVMAKKAAKAVLHGAQGYDDVDLDEM